MTSWLLYFRWLWSGDPKPPTGIRVYRQRGPVAFVWGSGTDATLDNYVGLLWYFHDQGATVVACDTVQAHDGVDLAKAAQYARSLYGIREVVGIGHSGGGGGVLVAGGKDASLFDRIVVMATGRAVQNMPRCPALFVYGDNDTKISVDGFLALASSYRGEIAVAHHVLADHFTITRYAGEAAAEFGLRGTTNAIKDDPYWTIVS